MMILEKLIDKKLVDWIYGANLDDLAPQLGKVVRELLEEEERKERSKKEESKVYKDIRTYLGSTVLTDNFKNILRGVFGALRYNGVFAKWLNLDMGSGKTHLLTLITYVLYAYDVFEPSGVLDEYRELGLTADVANTAALLLIDLRTPSEFYQTYLRFFAKHLRKIGETHAADYVEECVKTGKIPDAQKLVSSLRRARPVVIIDELHHAALTYRSVEKERDAIEKILAFVLQLVNYLRHYGRGFVLLVASARRDYERLLQLSGIEKDPLVVQAENLISQLGRIEYVVETAWLSVEEAKEIVLKKLGALRKDVLHPLFDRLIARVIKAESDIPQAQHLRSLIKAIAAYAKRSMELGFSVISPAAFSETVIDALFPEGGGVAERYRSVYRLVLNEIKAAPVGKDVKDATELAVNAILTMSITGRPDQIVEMIKAQRFGRYNLEQLPAVSGKEIEDLLVELGIKYEAIMDSFKVLENLPYVHYVKFGSGYLYFVLPVERVVAVFRRYIDERFRHYLADVEELDSKFVQWLYTISGERGGAHIKVVGSFSELEDATKGLDADRMYVIIYAEPGLVRHLEEAVRRSASADIDAEVKRWFSGRGLRDPARWLEEHGRPNVAIAVPVLSGEVLRDVATYSAIEDALAKVVADYLAEYQKDSKKLPDQLKKIIEIELDDIHEALGNALQDAISRARSALAKGLSYVYVYECSVAGRLFTCKSQLKNIATDVAAPVRRPSIPSEYSRLIEILNERRDMEFKDVAKQLVERVKLLANFVDEIHEAQKIIRSYVESSLKEYGEVEVRKDANMIQFANKIFYIPPSKLLAAAFSISENELDERLKTKVEKSKTEDYVAFRISRRAEGPTVSPKSPHERQEMDQVAKALEELSALNCGAVELLIEFDEKSKGTLRSVINVVRKYVKKIEVRQRICGQGARDDEG